MQRNHLGHIRTLTGLFICPWQDNGESPEGPWPISISRARKQEKVGRNLEKMEANEPVRQKSEEWKPYTQAQHAKPCLMLCSKKGTLSSPGLPPRRALISVSAVPHCGENISKTARFVESNIKDEKTVKVRKRLSSASYLRDLFAPPTVLHRVACQIPLRLNLLK